MNNPLSKLLLILAFTLGAVGSEARPETQLLLTITNDRDSARVKMSVTVDSQHRPTQLNYDGRAVSLQQMNTTQGAVLEEDQGVKAILLKGRFDGEGGRGRLVFRFVTNGMTGTYGECGIDVQRDAARKWHLVSSGGRAVQSARIITWSLGITTIQGICSP